MSNREKFLEFFSNNKEYELLEKINLKFYKIKHTICGKIFTVNYQNFYVNGSRCPNNECKIKRAKETIIKKYGVDNVMKNDNVKIKLKQTVKKKYGVSCVFKNSVIKEKIKNHFLSKYGVSNPSLVPEIKKKREETNLERFGTSSVLSNEEIKNKIKKTNLKKYGYETSLSSPKIISKRIKTNLKKYGVTFPIKNNEIKEKIKRTNLERYGEENPLLSKGIKAKVEKTILKKYGVKNVFSSDIIKSKIKEKIKEKYGVINPSQSEEIKKKKENTFLKKYGVSNPLKIKEMREKIKEEEKVKYYEKIKRFDNVNALFNLQEYKGVYDIKNKEPFIYKWECKKCKNIFEDYFYCRLPRCPVCYPLKSGTSVSEIEIKDFLLRQGIEIQWKKRFDDDKKYEIDIFIPSKNIGIELNGIYWHSELSGDKSKRYHLDKTKYFLERGIKIIHIWDSEWLEKQEIVKSIIFSKIGIYNKKIFARNCEIKRLSPLLSKEFFNKTHIQGYVNSTINIGLYIENSLVSCLSISKPRFNNNFDYEITRFSNELHTTVIGGFSKLLSYFIKEYKPNNILTYADRRFSSGDLYLKNKFSLIKESSPNYFYTKDYKILESREKYQKHKLKSILPVYDNNLSEWENMQNNKYDRVWDCGNLVFYKQFTFSEQESQ
jgi:hypothetical protein